MANLDTRLRKPDIQCWRDGHREAEKVIRKERIRSLCSRSAGDALAIYLSLAEIRLGNASATKPSYTLLAMRRALDRHSRRT